MIFLWLFEQHGFLMNVIGVSCKRKELIREIQAQKVVEALELGEIKSRQRLNKSLVWVGLVILDGDHIIKLLLMSYLCILQLLMCLLRLEKTISTMKIV